MKRVAMIVPGGVGKPGSMYVIPALQELVRRLSDEYEIEVFCVGSYGHSSEEYFMGKARIHYIHRDRHNTSPLQWKPLLLVRHILKKHKSNHFDLIHGISALPTGLLAVILGKLLHVPSILSLQGGEAAAIPEIPYGNMLKRSHRLLTKASINFADEVTALTHFQIKQLRKAQVLRDDIHVIPYGVDISIFSQRKQKDLHPPYHFLHVANLTEVKDQATLLKAFRLIAQRVDCDLRIIGKDYLNGKLQKIVEKLGIEDKVEFRGYIFPENLSEHYDWAHILLHTSMYEGQGVVCVEAVSSGVVVCGTRVGILSDLSDSMVITVDVGDFSTLALKVLKLLEEPSHYYLLEQKAHRWAQEHSIDWSVKRYSEIYERLLSLN